jgi:hypothetical protein
MINGALVLVCHQVDDFAIASKSPAAAEKLIAIINKHATTASRGIGVLDDQGLGIQYNGIGLHQTHHYVKLSCETYINRVLQTHGWEKPGPKESDRFDSVPLFADTATALLLSVGPSEDSAKHSNLERDVGFGYHQVLGELIYAYVVCHLDRICNYSSGPFRSSSKSSALHGSQRCCKVPPSD